MVTPALLLVPGTLLGWETLALPLSALIRLQEDLCTQLLSFSDFALRRVELMTWVGALGI